MQPKYAEGAMLVSDKIKSKQKALNETEKDENTIQREFIPIIFIQSTV